MSLSFSHPFFTIQFSPVIHGKSSCPDSMRPYRRQGCGIRGADFRRFRGTICGSGSGVEGCHDLFADLARQITIDTSFDFIAVSSYGGSRQHSGEVKLVKDVTSPWKTSNVILVEDILDTD